MTHLSFNPLSCVMLAYRKTWAERGYLAKMIIVPLLVKFLCYAVAVNYIGQDNLLHIAFVMLPAYLIEGWFLSHWVRTVIINHRWPFRFSGDVAVDQKNIRQRARGVMGGLVCFALANFLIAGYFAYFVSLMPKDLNPENATPETAIVGIAMIISSFALFRFIWAYIPVSLNISIQFFIHKFRKLSVTVPMITVWLLCFVPFYLVMGGLSGLVNVDNTVTVLDGLDIFIQVVLDMIKNLVTTAAFAYVIIGINQKDIA